MVGAVARLALSGGCLVVAIGASGRGSVQGVLDLIIDPKGKKKEQCEDKDDLVWGRGEVLRTS